jgi:hypothetical protein
MVYQCIPLYPERKIAINSFITVSPLHNLYTKQMSFIFKKKNHGFVSLILIKTICILLEFSENLGNCIRLTVLNSFSVFIASSVEHTWEVNDLIYSSSLAKL